MGLLESLAGSQRGVGRCELVTNQDYRNTGNAITRNNSGRINLGQLPEKSVNRKSVITGKCLTN